MNKIKVIAICGRSGSGKDTLRSSLLQSLGEKGHSIVSCTTRPKRENEVDGIAYHFVSTADLLAEILDGSIIESTEFNDWWYATRLEDLDEMKINVGVFNPKAIEILIEDDRLDVCVLEIVAREELCLLRCLQREFNPNCAEICRRFLADLKDYEKFNNKDIVNYFFFNDDDRIDILNENITLFLNWLSKKYNFL